MGKGKRNGLFAVGLKSPKCSTKQDKKRKEAKAKKA
jgi:hypothetical protein